MIFVTVGTHEQGFDRLVRYVDDMVGTQQLKSKVFIQYGYSNYRPVNTESSQWLTASAMRDMAAKCDTYVTHGGPGSIILAWEVGKLPIVVPRQERHGEHVDNHQVEFTKYLESRKLAKGVYYIQDLKDCLINQPKLTSGTQILADLRRSSSELCANLFTYTNMLFST